MIKSIIFTLVIVAVGASLAVWLWFSEPHGHDDHAGHDDHGHTEEEEISKGPHGGRLLTQDAFAIELKLFEKGVPPEFHVYSYYAGKPVDTKEVVLNIELKRLDGQIDRFEFQPQNDYLRGNGVVYEPHSFDVTINASYQGKAYQWQYENHEGRVQINNDIAKEAGITTQKAASRKIMETLMLTGRVQTDPSRISHVRARFPGVVKKIHFELGEQVQKGSKLAEIQSNESLQNYIIEAPISGVIMRREAQLGEATGDAPLFTITDLSKVWVELDVFDKDLSRVKKGQTVQIETLSGNPVTANIAWISPVISHASQSVQARVVLENNSHQFKPGQFIRGRVNIDEHSVPLAVRKSAIQTFRDFQVVFAKINDTYEVRMLELGRSDHDWIEVLSGLKPGTEYVTENSYLIKADIEKSGASHDH